MEIKYFFILFSVIVLNFLDSVSAARYRNYNANARIRDFYSNGTKLSSFFRASTIAKTTTTTTTQSPSTKLTRRRPVRPSDLLVIQLEENEGPASFTLSHTTTAKRMTITTKKPTTTKQRATTVSTETSTSTTTELTTKKRGPYFVTTTAFPPKKLTERPVDGTTDHGGTVKKGHTEKPSTVEEPFFVPGKNNIANIQLSTSTPRTTLKFLKAFTSTKAASSSNLVDTTTAPPRGPYIISNPKPKPLLSEIFKPSGPFFDAKEQPQLRDSEASASTAASSNILFQTPSNLKPPVVFSVTIPPQMFSNKGSTHGLTKGAHLRKSTPIGGIRGPLFPETTQPTPSASSLNKLDASDIYITTESPGDYVSSDYYDDAENYVEEDEYYEETDETEIEDDGVDIDSIVPLPPKIDKPAPHGITFTFNDLKFQRPVIFTPQTTTTTTTTKTTTTTPRPKPARKPVTKHNNYYHHQMTSDFLPIAPDMSSASYLNDLALNTNYQVQIPLNASLVQAPSVAIPPYSPDMMMYQFNSTIEDMILSSYVPMMLSNLTNMVSSLYNNYTMYMNSMIGGTTPPSSGEQVISFVYLPCDSSTTSTTTAEIEITTVQPPKPPVVPISTFNSVSSSSLSSSGSSSSSSSSDTSSSSVSIISPGGISSTVLAGFFLILPVIAGVLALFDVPSLAVAIVVAVGVPILLLVVLSVTGAAAFGRDDKAKYQFKGLDGLASEWDRHSAAIIDIIESYVQESGNHYHHP